MDLDSRLPFCSLVVPVHEQSIYAISGVVRREALKPELVNQALA